MAYLPLLTFNIEDNQININNDSVILLDWYQDIVEICEGEEERIIEYLKYIYLVLDPGSIFSEDVNLERRLAKALQNTDLTQEEVNQEEVLTALSEYEHYLSLNTELGLIQDMFTAINISRKKLRNIDYDEVIEAGAGKGQPKYKLKDTFSIAAQAAKILTSLGDLKTKIGNSISEAQKKSRENNMKASRRPTFFSEAVKK